MPPSSAIGSQRFTKETMCGKILQERQKTSCNGHSIDVHCVSQMKRLMIRNNLRAVSEDGVHLSRRDH
jgi:hypothetical protein